MPNRQQTVQDRLAALFLATFFSVLNALMGTVAVIPLEYKVVRHEYANGYFRLTAYYLARVAAAAAFQVFYGAVFVLIHYHLCGFNPTTEALLGTMADIILLGCIGNAIGMGVGCCLTRVEFAINTVPLVMLPLIIFCGFFQVLCSFLRPAFGAEWVEHPAIPRPPLVRLAWSPGTPLRLGRMTVMISAPPQGSIPVPPGPVSCGVTAEPRDIRTH